MAPRGPGQCQKIELLKDGYSLRQKQYQKINYKTLQEKIKPLLRLLSIKYNSHKATLDETCQNFDADMVYISLPIYIGCIYCYIRVTINIIFFDSIDLWMRPIGILFL